MKEVVKHQDFESDTVDVEITLDREVYYAMKNHAKEMNLPLASWLALADNAMFTTAVERKTCVIGVPAARFGAAPKPMPAPGKKSPEF